MLICNITDHKYNPKSVLHIKRIAFNSLFINFKPKANLQVSNPIGLLRKNNGWNRFVFSIKYFLTCILVISNNLLKALQYN